MNKKLIALFGTGCLAAGGYFLHIDETLAGALFLVIGLVAIGVVLPPTDHDTTGGSGASDAN